MFYILHNSTELKFVQEKLIPLLEGREHQLITYPTNPDFNPEKEAVLLTYLNDEALRDFITLAAKNGWQVGILPYSDTKYTLKGLEISGKLVRA